MKFVIRCLLAVVCLISFASCTADDKTHANNAAESATIEKSHSHAPSVNSAMHGEGEDEGDVGDEEDDEQG